MFPDVVFDKNISEDDGLWDATGGNETHEGFVARIKGAFDDVWARSQGSDCKSSTCEWIRVRAENW